MTKVKVYTAEEITLSQILRNRIFHYQNAKSIIIQFWRPGFSVEADFNPHMTSKAVQMYYGPLVLWLVLSIILNSAFYRFLKWLARSPRSNKFTGVAELSRPDYYHLTYWPTCRRTLRAETATVHSQRTQRTNLLTKRSLGTHLVYPRVPTNHHCAD